MIKENGELVLYAGKEPEIQEIAEEWNREDTWAVTQENGNENETLFAEPTKIPEHSEFY